MTADRNEHCAFAVLNTSGKCIAVCHRNEDNDYDCDCIGNITDSDLIEDGREIQLCRANNIWRL
jgi:hypothetical protein